MMRYWPSFTPLVPQPIHKQDAVLRLGRYVAVPVGVPLSLSQVTWSDAFVSSLAH